MFSSLLGPGGVFQVAPTFRLRTGVAKSSRMTGGSRWGTSSDPTGRVRFLASSAPDSHLVALEPASRGQSLTGAGSCQNKAGI